MVRRMFACKNMIKNERGAPLLFLSTTKKELANNHRTHFLLVKYNIMNW